MEASFLKTRSTGLLYDFFSQSHEVTIGPLEHIEREIILNSDLTFASTGRFDVVHRRCIALKMLIAFMETQSS